MANNCENCKFGNKFSFQINCTNEELLSMISTQHEDKVFEPNIFFKCSFHKKDKKEVRK